MGVAQRGGRLEADCAVVLGRGARRGTHCADAPFRQPRRVSCWSAL